MQEELCLTKQQQRSKQHGFLLTACLVLILLLVALTTAIAVLVARDYTSSRVITAAVEDEEARSVLTQELALQQLQAELHTMKSDANEMKTLLLAAIQNRDVGYEAPPHSRRKRRADENETWPLSRLGTNATAVETAESTVVTSGGVTLGEEIENLRRRVDMLARDALLAGSKNASSGEGGAVYVRWGRTSCPETGAELIYDGVAGNSHHTHTGGGGDYQCLPNEPQWGRYADGFQGKNYIYGVEHEINGYNPFLDSHLSGEALANQDAVCAVCRTQGRASKLMIPAWKTCPQSWTMEYHGYLASEHTTHKGRTNFVCVDEDPDVKPGGVTSVDGGLWYVVEPMCGALPCPRYVSGRELTCVLCTK